MSIYVRLTEDCPRCGGGPVELRQVWRGAATTPGGISDHYYVECQACGHRASERRPPSAAVNRFVEGWNE